MSIIDSYLVLLREDLNEKEKLKFMIKQFKLDNEQKKLDSPHLLALLRLKYQDDIVLQTKFVEELEKKLKELGE